MKKLLILMLMLFAMSSCEIVEIETIDSESIVENQILNSQSIDTIAKITKKEYQLFLDLDSLKQKTGIEVMNGPIIIDYNNNGKYDIIVNRRIMNRTSDSYTYELLNPVVILDNKEIIEITNMWKGGSTSAVADFNGDGFLDIAIMDNGPEYWDLNPNPKKTDLIVYWNINGVFDGKHTFVKEMTNGCYNINTGDVNGDGKYEIIPMGNQFEDFSYEFDGNTFVKTEITNLKNISHTPAFYGDFNNDNRVDIFSYGFHQTGKLDLFKPTIIHNAQSPTEFNQFDLGEKVYVNIMLSGDFDKDGFTDFILIARKEGPGGAPLNGNHYLYYIKNNGGKNYTIESDKLPQYLNPSLNSGYPMFYIASDIDGDGDLDFYNINSKLNIFFINENGKFKLVNKF